MLASKKAVATHENWVPRSRTSDIVGSAVLVTLPSRADSKRGMHIATKDRQKPSSRLHFWLSVCEGNEGNVGRLRARARASSLCVGRNCCSVGSSLKLPSWVELLDEATDSTLDAGIEDRDPVAILQSTCSTVKVSELPFGVKENTFWGLETILKAAIIVGSCRTRNLGEEKELFFL